MNSSKASVTPVQNSSPFSQPDELTSADNNTIEIGKGENNQDEFQEISLQAEPDIENVAPSNMIKTPEIRSRKCTVRRALCVLATISIAVTALYALLIGFNGEGGSAGSGWLPDWLWPDEDPFDGTTYSWDPKYIDSNGLSLTLINSLDERWHSYFETAVSEWDNGSPDVLTLTTKNDFSGSDCTASNGIMRVCSDDYGDTGWKGENQAVLFEGYLVSSVAMMNDYYHQHSTDDDKQYTMCHELGHGFGLSHTDERFWNRDRRECMDYTNHPEHNKHPGQVNFDRLWEIYGKNEQATRNLKRASLSTREDNQKFAEALDRFALERAKLSLLEGDHHSRTLSKRMRASAQTDQNISHHVIDLGEGFTGIIHRLLI